jgi:hypothetical protein
MRCKRFVVLGLAALLAMSASIAPAGAAASGRGGTTVIAFESDPIGEQPDGFTSVDSAVAHFYDSRLANLDLNAYGVQGDGISLAVNYDDQSFLQIQFDVEVCSISLEFGNDDPCCSNPGDRAHLRVREGATKVGWASVRMNRNDLMDQSISVSEVQFNRAEFWYAVTTPGLIEIVDNITYTTC